MTKGSIIVFDELNDPKWRGETMALLESFNLNKIKLEKFSYEPNLTYLSINEKK